LKEISSQILQAVRAEPKGNTSRYWDAVLLLSGWKFVKTGVSTPRMTGGECRRDGETK